MHDGIKTWTTSSREYLKAAIIELEPELLKVGKKLCTKTNTPTSNNYKLELDSTAELKCKNIIYFQELIGILR